jgi:hypothetical protein
MRDHREDVDISNVQTVRKVCREQGGMERLEQIVLAGEFSGLKGQAGIGQKGPVSKGDPERRTHGAKVPHDTLDVIGREALCHGGPLKGRLGMDLHATPFDLKIELLFQLFDDAFADIAEGSNVIGIYLNAYGHKSDLVLSSIEALAQ